MIALAWVFAYATEARTIQWVSPWEMELIEPYGDCAQLCGNLSALYLSDTGCKSNDIAVTGDLVRFCPDNEVIEAWTVENEEAYVAMYHRGEELLMPERKILERMDVERTMKLSVHPWQRFQFQEVRSLVERRRNQASSVNMRCAGKSPRIGTKKTHYVGDKPQKVAIEFELNNGEQVISHFEMKYPSGKFKGGTPDLSSAVKKRLPECVTLVFVKSTDENINGINFLSQGRETRLLGSDINESDIYVAPRGKCLGDMRMRYDQFVNRLCFRFNADE